MTRRYGDVPAPAEQAGAVAPSIVRLVLEEELQGRAWVLRWREPGVTPGLLGAGPVDTAYRTALDVREGAEFVSVTLGEGPPWTVVSASASGGTAAVAGFDVALRCPDPDVLRPWARARFGADV